MVARRVFINANNIDDSMIVSKGIQYELRAGNNLSRPA